MYKITQGTLTSFSAKIIYYLKVIDFDDLTLKSMTLMVFLWQKRNFDNMNYCFKNDIKNLFI